MRATRILTLIAAVLGALALVPAVAHSQVTAITEVEFPAVVKPGQTGLTGTLVLTNSNAEALFSLDSMQSAPGDNVVCNAGDSGPCTGDDGIVLTPSCKQSAEGVCDSMSGADPGVFAIAPTATGRPGSTCAGAQFTVSAPHPQSGRLVVAPQGSGNLVIPVGGMCRIDMTFEVLMMPTGDAGGEPGIQTHQLAFATQVLDGEFADGDAGEDSTTVQLATPALATTASPDVVLGTGTLSAGALLSGAASPAGQTVGFMLFAPGDVACTTPIFSSPGTLSAGGAATSAAFAPSAAGTYRWITSYAGDANNAPASSACGAPGSTVTVVAPASPPPPPPPPPPGPPGATPAGPQLVSATFSTPTPRVGQPVLLEIRATDPQRPISGVQVRFGEPSGVSGISACSVPSFPTSITPEIVRLPYTFQRPGVHTITIVILSGDCSTSPARTVETITITILPEASARAGLAAGAASAPAAPTPPAAGPCPGRRDLPKNTPLSRTKVAKAVLCVVNLERRKRGLRKLVRSKLLEKAATNHSRDMLKRKYFQHVGRRGPSFPARLKRVRYRGLTAAENIGYGSDFNADLIVRAWMNSPGHRANILRRNMSFGGLGVVVGVPVSPARPGATYTMVFGKSVR